MADADDALELADAMADDLCGFVSDLQIGLREEIGREVDRRVGELRSVVTTLRHYLDEQLVAGEHTASSVLASLRGQHDAVLSNVMRAVYQIPLPGLPPAVAPAAASVIVSPGGIGTAGAAPAVPVSVHVPSPIVQTPPRATVPVESAGALIPGAAGAGPPILQPTPTAGGPGHAAPPPPPEIQPTGPLPGAPLALRGAPPQAPPAPPAQACVLAGVGGPGPGLAAGPGQVGDPDEVRVTSDGAVVVIYRHDPQNGLWELARSVTRLSLRILPPAVADQTPSDAEIADGDRRLTLEEVLT